MRFAGAASSSASRSCDRSTSWTSSTSRCAHRSPPPIEQRRLASRGGRGRRGPGRRSRADHAPQSAPRTSTKARATGPAPGSAATSAAVTARSSFSRENAVSRRPRSAGVVRGHSSAMSVGAVDERLDRAAGVAEDLAAEGVERPDADGPRRDAQRLRAPASARSPSSSAARLLKVIAAIVAGSAPPSTSQAIRATSVVVLPLPAGATQRTGPGGAVAAARWSGVSRARRSWTAGWRHRRRVSRTGR